MLLTEGVYHLGGFVLYCGRFPLYVVNLEVYKERTTDKEGDIRGISICWRWSISLSLSPNFVKWMIVLII